MKGSSSKKPRPGGSSGKRAGLRQNPRSLAVGRVLPDCVQSSEIGLTIPVRAAKAKLSTLLELIAAGTEVAITSRGTVKAVLSPVKADHGRKTFKGMGGFLSRQPIHKGPSADQLVREDRDSRGW